MKKIYIILIAIITCFYACEDCECDLIDEIPGDNPFDCLELNLNIGDDCDSNADGELDGTVSENCECIPVETFDCPDLELNIGDSCDSNADGELDGTVSEDCECISNACSTDLLLMQAFMNTDSQLTFTLDALPRPLTYPLAPENITTDNNGFDLYPRPSNQSTYDAATNRYFIQFSLDETMYVHDIDAQTVTSLANIEYSAPVIAADGQMYAMFIEGYYATNPAQFDIVSLDMNSLAATVLTTESFPLVSNFNWESVASTALEDGRVFFVSFSNLIEYDPATNTATHHELVPDWDQSTNFQRFYGLETRNNGNILAIQDAPDFIGIVEINPDNPNEITPVFNFADNGMENVNSEFSSTTYDACDDTYYLTTRGYENTNESIFYEIDLSEGTVVSETFDHYVYGVQLKQ